MKTIKSITIKGLEPEIQRLIDKHKADISRCLTFQIFNDFR